MLTLTSAGRSSGELTEEYGPKELNACIPEIFPRSCPVTYKEIAEDSLTRNFSNSVVELMNQFDNIDKTYFSDRLSLLTEKFDLLSELQKPELTADLALKIKKLFQELRSILNQFISKQRRVVRLISTRKCNTKIKDSRRHIRNTIHSLYKYLPEFSDCDENDRFTQHRKVNRTLHPHNSENYVQHRFINRRDRFNYRICA